MLHPYWHKLSLRCCLHLEWVRFFKPGVSKNVGKKQQRISTFKKKYVDSGVVGLLKMTNSNVL